MATRLQERKEAEARRLDEALAAMAEARRRHRDRLPMIDTVLDGVEEYELYDMPEPIRNVAIAGYTCPHQHRNAFRLVIHQVELHARRLLEARGETGGNPYLVGLQSLAEQRKHWIRQLGD